MGAQTIWLFEKSAEQIDGDGFLGFSTCGLISATRGDLRRSPLVLERNISIAPASEFDVQSADVLLPNVDVGARDVFGIIPLVYAWVLTFLSGKSVTFLWVHISQKPSL